MLHRLGHVLFWTGLILTLFSWLMIYDYQGAAIFEQWRDLMIASIPAGIGWACRYVLAGD